MAAIPKIFRSVQAIPVGGAAMNETVQFIAQYGYWILILAVLGKQACLPIPTTLFVLAAGALAHSGGLSLYGVIGVSVMTFLLADLAWYEAGRRSGDRILHFVCGHSRDPEASVKRATTAFANHGLRTLLVSKFVFGLDAVAAPLAGTAAVPRSRFLIFDALGATIWTTCFAISGYVFSDQLDAVAGHIIRTGAIVGLTVVAGSCLYLVYRFARWQRFVRRFRLARITPEQLREKLIVGEDILIVDLQGTGNSVMPVAIPGAVRIDAGRLEEYKDVFVWPSRDVVLYCASPGDFTSARVAFALQQKGVEGVHPLSGGLRGWLDRGFPVTSEVRIPPTPVLWVSSSDGIPSHS
jgi:membrane protein DedA with SNARE-associated domain/rhodanese-related sulfurtransferase